MPGVLLELVTALRLQISMSNVVTFPVFIHKLLYRFAREKRVTVETHPKALNWPLCELILVIIVRFNLFFKF